MKFRNSARLIHVALVAIATIAIFFAFNAFSNRGFPAASESENLALLVQIPEKSLRILYSVTEMDLENQYLTVRLVPSPNDAFGGGLAYAWYLTEIDVQITVDSLTTTNNSRQTSYFFEGHPEYWILYGSLDITLDVIPFVPWHFWNNPSLYPFDSYPYVMPVIVEQRPWSDEPIGNTTTTAALLDWEGLPVVMLPWLTNVNGFQFDVRPAPFFEVQNQEILLDEAAEDWSNGFAAVEIRARRLFGVRVLVGLIALVMILNLVALSSVVLKIATSQRPPSAQVLVWVAALSFATVAVRQSLPYSPPPGIVLDYLLFFPTLVFSAVATVVVGFAWSNRADYCS
jgi:hypothetical protein